MVEIKGSRAAGASVERILSGGAVGLVAKEHKPFYLNFELLSPNGEDLCVEVTFNPEFVDFDGAPTDVVVGWGR